jgi:hypothetical protein
LPKSLVSSSHYDASPHTIVGSPHLRLGKFAFSDAKRLFRQHRPISEVAARLIKVGSMGHSGLDLLKLGFSHFDPNRTSRDPRLHGPRNSASSGGR